MDSGLRLLDSRFLVNGTWIRDSNRSGDSGFLEVSYGFQNPGFQVSTRGRYITFFGGTSSKNLPSEVP